MYHHQVSYQRLSQEKLASWQQIPTSIIGDCLNRASCMAAAIKGLAEGQRLSGHARTVQTMVGDNSTIHAALDLCEPGDVLVVDGGGIEDIALWGGLITRAAIARGVVGTVLDGGCRDSVEIRSLGFPVFCRSISPRGPHKGFGGVIDAAVSVGGVAVRPGDIVVGDDDGVVVVPLPLGEKVMAQARERIKLEQGILDSIRAGKSTVEVLGLSRSQPIEQAVGLSPGGKPVRGQ